MSRAPVLAPRCCDTHADWNQLCTHLQRDLVDIEPDLVARELAEAASVIQRVGLPEPEHLPTAELIVRYRFMTPAEGSTGVARLMPENHHRRRKAAVA
jgi:hypothetical protein